MAIEHKFITDAERHEPKGASSAIANSVWVADGVGSGAFRKIKSTDLSGMTGDGGVAGKDVVSDGANGFKFANADAHGAMTITNNVTGFAITAAVDPTFNTPSDFVLITGVGGPWAGELLHDITFDTNKLTVSTTGIYRIDLWGNISAWAANNSSLCFRYKLNGTTLSSRKPVVKTDASSVPRQVAGFGLLSLNAGDYVQLFVAGSATGNYTFADLNTTISIVRAL